MATPLLGLGACPLGSTPIGCGLPATADVITKTIWVTAEGAQGTAPEIDPVTRDYVVDSYGHTRGYSTIQQQVYLALFTIKGSAADFNFGLDTSTLDKRTSNTAKRADTAVRAALKRLVDKRAIAIVSVDLKTLSPTSVRLEVNWRDTATDTLNTTRVL